MLSESSRLAGLHSYLFPVPQYTGDRPVHITVVISSTVGCYQADKVFREAELWVWAQHSIGR